MEKKWKSQSLFLDDNMILGHSIGQNTQIQNGKWTLGIVMTAMMETNKETD